MCPEVALWHQARQQPWGYIGVTVMRAKDSCAKSLLQRLPRPRHFGWRPESKIAERNIYRAEGLEPQEHRSERKAKNGEHWCYLERCSVAVKDNKRNSLWAAVVSAFLQLQRGFWEGGGRIFNSNFWQLPKETKHVGKLHWIEEVFVTH